MLVPERGDPTTKIGLFMLRCIQAYGLFVFLRPVKLCTGVIRTIIFREPRSASLVNRIPRMPNPLWNKINGFYVGAEGRTTAHISIS